MVDDPPDLLSRAFDFPSSLHTHSSQSDTFSPPVSKDTTQFIEKSCFQDLQARFSWEKSNQEPPSGTQQGSLRSPSRRIVFFSPFSDELRFFPHDRFTHVILSLHVHETRTNHEGLKIADLPCDRSVYTGESEAGWTVSTATTSGHKGCFILKDCWRWLFTASRWI